MKEVKVEHLSSLSVINASAKALYSDITEFKISLIIKT